MPRLFRVVAFGAAFTVTVVLTALVTWHLRDWVRPPVRPVVQHHTTPLPPGALTADAPVLIDVFEGTAGAGVETCLVVPQALMADREAGAGAGAARPLGDRHRGLGLDYARRRDALQPPPLRAEGRWTQRHATRPHPWLFLPLDDGGHPPVQVAARRTMVTAYDHDGAAMRFTYAHAAPARRLVVDAGAEALLPTEPGRPVGGQLFVRAGLQWPGTVVFAGPQWDVRTGPAIQAGVQTRLVALGL
jgi:hypothetical protein